MKIPQMVLAEIRRLTATPMARIALLALCVVPLLYGGVYLWANQDPYERLDRVPVAIVVLDEGTEVDGERQYMGQDVADEVIADGSFDWHLVNEHQAQEGVENGTYDFSLTFPETFSEDLLSASTDEPHPASILLTTNDANSYLASTIGEQAVQRIQSQVREQVGKEAAVRLLTSIQTIRDGMVEAADGAAQLDDGLAQLVDGATTLETGAGELSDGLSQLHQSTQTLPQQTRELANGAEQVAQGNEQIANAGEEAATASQQLVNGLENTRTEIVQSLQGLGLSDDEIAQVMQHLDGFGGLVADGNSRVQNVNNQLQQLSNGARQVANGADTLADGTVTLSNAIADADEGSSRLASGAGELREGTESAANGAGQLREGLEDGLERIPESSKELIDEQASTIAAAVEVDNDSVTRAGTYGAGLAPFFISLAAWIGIYALLLIIKPVSKRAITALHQPVRVAVAAWLTPTLFGVLQMTALIGVIAAWLQFDIAHPLQTYGIMALASATFAAIIVALNVWLGSVGQFTGLVLLVLQLVTAGGTFPWQTLPEPLTTLHHLLPMSYAVDALRQVMYGGNLEAAWTGTFVLFGFLLAALALTAVGVARMMDHRTLRDLQPSLIG